MRLKDGTPSAGKRVLIDGQRRVTALVTALLGYEVLTKDYAAIRVRIAFHPVEERFEISNPAIQKDKTWIPDISVLFSPSASLFSITSAYMHANPDADSGSIAQMLEAVEGIVNNRCGLPHRSAR